MTAQPAPPSAAIPAAFAVHRKAGPLAGRDGITHGFFGRRGGVSAPPFDSLNAGFGTGDPSARVAENRERIARALALEPSRLIAGNQTHSAMAAILGPDSPAAPPPRADALVTRVPGLGLGILTADCAPVLFADPEARVIGAAHAGWRGALTGILDATLDAMEREGASRRRIIAAIGPCIGPRSYEVGPEFPAPFLDLDRDFGRFFQPAARPDHQLFDLPGFIAERLYRAGIETLAMPGEDSCADEDGFFSYRRSVLRKEKATGRQLSVIALATP